MSLKQNESMDAESVAEFDTAFQKLTEMVDLSEADSLYPVRCNAVYTTSVVLWMLVYQRMEPDSSLESAVKKLLEDCPGLLPKNKRVTEGRLSSNTSSYSHARSRLSEKAVTWLADRISRSIIEASPLTLAGRRVFIIDGTTIKLAPEPALRKAFPPASNQHGSGVWPIVLLAAAHELSSGAALNPAIGAMYGEDAVSETSLVGELFEQMPEDSVVMTDAGFGIFVVAHQARQAGHKFLLRMTKLRFQSLCKKAQLIEETAYCRTYAHRWQPSKQERRKHPELAADARLEVRLHEVEVHSNLTLYLVTDVDEPAMELATLFERRYDIEVDIRNLKVVLDAENIRARSVSMFRKELLASMISYNLVTQFRQQAAELINETPRRMSFTRIWRTFHIFLSSSMFTDAASWRDQYAKALSYAKKDKLPHRPDRSYPRAAYPQRPKSQQFEKRKPKQIE